MRRFDRAWPERAAFALALAAAACGGEPRTPREPAAGPSVEPVVEVRAGDAGAPVTDAPGAIADDVVNVALGSVARLRELRPTGAIRGRVVGREWMIDHLREKLGKEIPDDVIAGTREILVLLGLVPVDFDYEASILELMNAQLAGFYETDDRTMYLAEDLEGEERAATLSHELVHALQDQHYDLASKIDYEPDGGDRQAALHALAEGDATSAMLDALLEGSGTRATDMSDAMIAMQVRSAIALDPDAAQVPSILRQSIVVPYVDGIIFVNQLRRRGGWAAVDAVWADPPTTTEQILHLDKLDAREPALAVPLPSAPVGGPKRAVFHDVMGEQGVVLVLDQWLPRRPATEAAAGWGGDRIAVFRDGERHAMAWHVRYDDARSGEQAFVQIRNATMKLGASGGEACREREDRGPFAVAGKGRDVVLVAGPYARRGGTARSAGACPEALAWAGAVLGGGGS